MALRIRSNNNQRGQQMAKQANSIAPGQINMIGEGTVLEGTLRAQGDVRVSGRVVGKLAVAGKVIVAQEGVIDGELEAENADIAGLVDGEVRVSDRVVLKNTARIEGDIATARLVIEEGAIFAGKCVMEPADAASTVKRTLREAESGDGASLEAE